MYLAAKMCVNMQTGSHSGVIGSPLGTAAALSCCGDWPRNVCFLNPGSLTALPPKAPG